jgi:hypothetical protein
VGAITSREITYGINGWHPHLHSIWFLSKPLTDELYGELYTIVSARWRKVLQGLGGNASISRGFNLKPVNTDSDASFKAAVDYPIKQGAQWSATDELLAGGEKQAKNGNRSVAELLTDAHKGDGAAGALFVEYAICTKGRNLVVWTPGLKDLCGIIEEEKTDGELAEEKEKGGEVVIMITPEQWVTICAHKLRGRLLGALQRGGRDGLAQWFDLYSIDIKASQWEIGRYQNEE